MSDIKIRQAFSDDYPQIVEVVNSELPQYKTVYSEDELSQLLIGNFKLSDLTENEDKRHYLVAVEDTVSGEGTAKTQIVGFISWYLKPNGIAWVSLLTVLPEFQGQGIGKTLMAYVENIAQALGAKAVALETQKKSDWAIGFYKKLGYRVLEGDEWNQGIFESTLEKEPVNFAYILAKNF